MIQRVQSLFFFFSAICSVTIVYAFPVLQDESTSYLLKEHFADARLFVFLSVALSVFAIFQFRNRKRQQLIAYVARLMITIAFLLVVFLHQEEGAEERAFGIGLFLFFIPYLALFLAGYFVKKDEKLVKSADRMR
jgi:cell division protein FtsW (lipid II flippase)